MKLEYYNHLAIDRVQTILSEKNVIDAMAFAVENRIPLADALEAFAKNRRRSLWSKLLFRDNWEELVAELRKGNRLSHVLRGKIPSYLTYALAFAEKNDKLEQMLPQLANNLRFHRFYFTNMSMVIFRNIFFWIILLGFSVFILPNMFKIFDDLFSSAAGSWFYQYADFLRPEFLFLIPLIIILFTATFVEAMNLHSFDILYLKIPYFGTLIKRRVLSDLSGTFYCILACGADMPQAARAAIASEPRWWLRRRLKKFAARLEAGEFWLDAWQKEIKLDTPQSKWVLSNGVTRDRVQESFSDLQRILNEENINSNYRLDIVMEIIVILINALLIGFIGIFFFMVSAYIITSI